MGRGCAFALAKVALVISAGVLLAALFAPAVSRAQAAQGDSGLIAAIRGIIEESTARLSAEVQNLRSEVNSLRAELQSSRENSRGGGGVVTTTPAPTPTPPSSQGSFGVNLSTGSAGEDVRYLQQTLIRLGFNIPAGITGTYFSQTREAVERLQAQYGIPATGVVDAATRALLNRLTSSPSTPPTLPPEDEVSVTPPARGGGQQGTAPQTVITPTLRLISPQSGMLLDPGTLIPITWDTTYAPAGARIEFRLINRLSGANQLVLETEELSGTHDWVLPSNMASDNDFTAQLLYERDNNSTLRLASRSVPLSILGGSGSSPSATGAAKVPGTNASNAYITFYTGAAFTTCMKDYPATIALIKSWLDQGLLRYQFPWGQITGAAATKVAECEGGAFSDYGSYGTYGGSSSGGDSQCSSGFHHEYFEGGSAVCFSDGAHDRYQIGRGATILCSAASRNGCPGVSGGSGSGSGYNSGCSPNQYWDTRTNSCQSMQSACVEAGGSWNSSSNYCQMPGSGGGSSGGQSSMYRCFYPSATINGASPGYTVWCEYDYKNCHVGDPSGATVSTNGLSLGAPSSCESGWSGGTSAASNSSFLANVATALTGFLGGIGHALGF